ncbi:MAG: RDD family protein [Ectothiorhodospiraceae bacterium]|jgi:uncharacterized RDD family membrane protein YckC|nr:RDD family protein [Ectothiorhodospiraceae bacterium]
MTSASDQGPVGLLRRLACMLYDGMLLVAVLFFASLLATIPFGITHEHPLFWLYTLYIWLVSFVYFGWFWTRGGQTLGMQAWRVRLERPDGAQVSWRQSLLRYMGGLVYWLLTGLALYAHRHGMPAATIVIAVVLALAVAWTLRHPQRWMLQDLVSGTRLVRVPK